MVIPVGESQVRWYKIVMTFTSEWMISWKFNIFYIKWWQLSKLGNFVGISKYTKKILQSTSISVFWSCISGLETRQTVRTILYNTQGYNELQAWKPDTTPHNQTFTFFSRLMYLKVWSIPTIVRLICTLDYLIHEDPRLLLSQTKTFGSVPVLDIVL